MSKQNKKDRRQQIAIEIEALELKIRQCFSIKEFDILSKKVEELNKELKLCSR